MPRFMNCTGVENANNLIHTSYLNECPAEFMNFMKP